ncbi:DUF3575 domain-containing protein [Dysgonomonas reticulitermitis]
MFKPITLLLLLLSIAFTANLHGQDISSAAAAPLRAKLPGLAVKTNLLYDATTTFNLGGEFRLSDYLTLDVPVSYNPWTFPENRKFKHFLVQPELRYWLNEPFNGHFLGAHLLYSHFNIGNLPFGSLRDNRYQGDAYGLGFSYGYQWLLSSRWNLEATLGLGYVYLDYSRYECRACGRKTGEGPTNYFGATKAGISLIYIIK